MAERYFRTTLAVFKYISSNVTAFEGEGNVEEGFPGVSCKAAAEDTLSTEHMGLNTHGRWAPTKLSHLAVWS